jgi:hypothetical protein
MSLFSKMITIFNLFVQWFRRSARAHGLGQIELIRGTRRLISPQAK